MIARVFNPVVTSLLGLVLSVAVGLAASWKTLNVVVDRAVLLKMQKEPTELRKKGWDFWTIEMENLASELKEDRERLKKRSEELDHREARILAGEKELAKARADVDIVRKQISDRVIELAADEQANLRKLAQTYSNLTPRAVVAIIREMDDNTAVKIISLMKPDAVGPVFEEMSKVGSTESGTMARRAAILSEKLRLMRANKPSSPP